MTAFLRGLLVGAAIGIALVAAFTAAFGHGYHSRSGAATSYCQSGTTASGHMVGPGIAASNDVALGQWIELTQPRRVQGRRYWRVLDTGGPGFLLDLWSPSCSWSMFWGRRTVRFRVLPAHHLWRGLPEDGWRWSAR